MECGAAAGVRVCTGQRGSGGWEWNGKEKDMGCIQAVTIGLVGMRTYYIAIVHYRIVSYCSPENWLVIVCGNCTL